MASQTNSIVALEQVGRCTTRSRAATEAVAGQSETITNASPHVVTVVHSNVDSGGLDESTHSTTTPPAKKKGKKGSKTPRPTVYSLSHAVTGLQEFATGSTGQMSVLRNEVTTNNQMITGLYSRMDTMMKAISDMSSQFSQVNSPRNGNQVSASAPTQPVARPPSDDIQQVALVQQGQAQLLGLPAPPQLRREENHAGQVDTMVSQEDYRQPTGNGKTQTITSDTTFYKPYMFLDRENLETVKERLDARKSMTSMEYLSATLSLLDDPSAYDKRDKDNILKHLLAVSVDARVRPWPAVRQWTQLIWDNVEKGRCTWASYGFIQDERVRISYMNTAPSAHANPNTQQSKAPIVVNQEISTVVCRDFNSPGGCKFNHTHDAGLIKHLHVCSHCDGLGRRSHHSFQKCRTRAEPAGGVSGAHNQHDYRQWNNNNRYSNNSGYQQNAPYNQYRSNQYQGLYPKNV